MFLSLMVPTYLTKLVRVSFISIQTWGTSEFIRYLVLPLVSLKSHFEFLLLRSKLFENN